MSHSIPEPDADSPCDLLPWDSEFFSLRIARAKGNLLTPQRVADIDRWCAACEIDCLYFLARCDDAITISTAQAAGFHLPDMRVTLDRPMHGFHPNPALLAGIRPATEADLPALALIARASHTDTRFYYDGRFPKSRCDDLYEHWINVSFRGYAQVVFVAEDTRGPTPVPVGYVACHGGPDGGRIGLIAVAASAARSGWGTKLVHRALAWFAENNLPHVTVATQGRNIPAQRLFQRAGFLVQSLFLHYHKWYKTKDLDPRPLP